MTKLNVLLAKTDHLSELFRQSIKDYVQFFKNKQAAFRGGRKTYVPRPGTQDMPAERGVSLVVSTVGEKLKWFVDNQSEYIDHLFSQEATNASGNPKATLKVGDHDFGQLSSLELLRLKSLLENGDLNEMYKTIPVREDDQPWEACIDESYKNREVAQSPLVEGEKKSISKTSYILPDPNLAQLGDSSRYTPQVASKDEVITVGDYSYQKFTGEWNHHQRAELLSRKSALLNAVIAALKEANDCPAVTSGMTAQKLFNYLHKG